MMIVKTICPYCLCENTPNLPTYEENLISLQEMLVDESCKDFLEETQESINDIYEELKNGKKKTDFDLWFISVTPIFCNECKENYYYNPITKEYDYVKNFNTQRIVQKLNEVSKIKDSRLCFIYFLYNKENHLTKIGYTQNIKKRQQELKVGLTETELKIKFQTTKENAPSLENMFHNIFSKYHIKGEWFSIPDEIYEKITINKNLVQSLIAEGKQYHEIKTFIENSFEPIVSIKSDNEIIAIENKSSKKFA